MVRCFYKEEKHVLGREDIIGAAKRCRNPQKRALLSFQYLTASRISEATLLRRKDVKLLPDSIKFRIVTKKRRGTHRDEYRYIKIPIEQSRPLSDYIIKWVRIMPQYGDTCLFKGERSNKYYIKELTGHGTHCIRHSRLNHLSEAGFDQFDLQRFVNWGKPDMALEYIKRTGRQVHDKLLETGI